MEFLRNKKWTRILLITLTMFYSQLSWSLVEIKPKDSSELAYLCEMTHVYPDLEVQIKVLRVNMEDSYDIEILTSRLGSPSSHIYFAQPKQAQLDSQVFILEGPLVKLVIDHNSVSDLDRGFESHISIQDPESLIQKEYLSCQRIVRFM